MPFSHSQALYTKAAPGNELQPRFKINYTTDQPRLQVNIPSNRGYTARIFQIWSKREDYRELAGGFEPTRSGEILWINNNFVCSLFLYNTETLKVAINNAWRKRKNKTKPKKIIEIEIEVNK